MSQPTKIYHGMQLLKGYTFLYENNTQTFLEYTIKFTDFLKGDIMTSLHQIDNTYCMQRNNCPQLYFCSFCHHCQQANLSLGEFKTILYCVNQKEFLSYTVSEQIHEGKTMNKQRKAKKKKKKMGQKEPCIQYTCKQVPVQVTDGNEKHYIHLLNINISIIFFFSENSLSD